MEKPAETRHPIHDLLKRRWSPRAFSPKPVPRQQLQQLFEAAQWAPSSMNEQPWRFIVATKEDPAEFERALACLVEKNQQWAKGAPVLVLTCFKPTFDRNGKPNRVALHDLGLAAANLTVQATALDLFVHQMAGVEPDTVRATYGVPDEFEPATAIAIGYAGEPESLPEGFRESEVAPRTRKPLSQVVFTGRFGDAAPFVA